MSSGAPRVLLTLGHGRRESLVHRLAEEVRQELDGRGAAHRTQDLLADGFSPVLRLERCQRHARVCRAEDDALLHRYQEDVSWADRHVLLHPVWWFGAPAILRGWVDRVLAEGLAFEQPPGEAPRGLLDGRRVLLVQALGASRLVERLVAGSLATTTWSRGVFRPLGVTDVKRLAVHETETLTEARLEASLRRLRAAVRRLLA